MSIQCRDCRYEIPEEQLPRVVGAAALCPRCGVRMRLPELTMPFVNEAAESTLESRNTSSGKLDGDKKFALVVLKGRQAGSVHTIDKWRVTLGRDECDICLDDTEISRQHALLEIRGTDATLQDLGSTNGIHVDGSRVTQAPLQDRSEFRIGNHELMFVVTERELDLV